MTSREILDIILANLFGLHNSASATIPVYNGTSKFPQGSKKTQKVQKVQKVQKNVKIAHGTT